MGRLGVRFFRALAQQSGFVTARTERYNVAQWAAGNYGVSLRWYPAN